MVSIDREAARQLQAVCNFCTTAKPTSLNVAMLFQCLEEAKTKRQWSFNEANILKKRLLDALSTLVNFMYMEGAEITIIIPPTKSFIRPPDMHIRARVTDSLKDKIIFKVKVPDEILKPDENQTPFRFEFPLITYKIIELISRLPMNMLKICRATNCNSPFISNHMTKIYCSPRCRSRENIYATRRRLKERLKDAD